MQITTARDADTTIYTAIIDGTDAAELTVWTATREIANVETRAAYQRQGLASALWAHANAEGECFHSLDHHRTAEGDAFAHAVGGDTISDTDGYQVECIICTGEMED